MQQLLKIWVDIGCPQFGSGIHSALLNSVLLYAMAVEDLG
jgi:hypothetical protein